VCGRLLAPWPPLRTRPRFLQPGHREVAQPGAPIGGAGFVERRPRSTERHEAATPPAPTTRREEPGGEPASTDRDQGHVSVAKSTAKSVAGKSSDPTWWNVCARTEEAAADERHGIAPQASASSDETDPQSPHRRPAVQARAPTQGSALRWPRAGRVNGQEPARPRKTGHIRARGQGTGIVGSALRRPMPAFV